MKNVVVLGGGFAGISAILHLRKHLENHKVQITLVDRNPYHLWTPSLYEVATSEAPMKNIAIPFDKVFDENVTFIKSAVDKIDSTSQTVHLKKGEPLHYDYLVLALGSQPAYMSIPGLKEHSIAFKTLEDAVKIKDKINDMCCEEGKCNRKVEVVIGGGGFAGTELAAEMLTYKDRIAKQNRLDKSCLQVTIIQGSPRLLNELDERVSATAKERLNQRNVHYAFGGHIKEVTDQEVLTDNGKSYPYDILIWTGGVEANHLAKHSGLPVNKRGQVTVNNALQVEGFDNIFAAGDVAGFVDPKTKKPAPNVAQVAQEQGQTVGKNIANLLVGAAVEPYKYRHFGYVVPLRGHYSVAELMFGLHLKGFLGWCLQQIVLLRYLLEILPLRKALVRWNVFELELES